jgi:glutamate/aspartate transport system substrate-binding protein
MQPIPPNNVTLNMPASEATKDAWAHPNDKPAEEYKQPGQ